MPQPETTPLTLPSAADRQPHAIIPPVAAVLLDELPVPQRLERTMMAQARPHVPPRLAFLCQLLI